MSEPADAAPDPRAGDSGHGDRAPSGGDGPAGEVPAGDGPAGVVRSGSDGAPPGDRIAWLDGSDAALPGGGGLAWAWDLDADEFVQALTADRPPAAEAADGAGADEEAVLDEILAARDRGECVVLTGGQVAGRVAERLPAGPGLAAVLAAAAAEEVAYADLPAAAAGYRRLAGWAQARELAAVAQIAARSAAADPRIGTGPDGRPDQVTRSAAGEVSLALVLTHAGAAAWTDLAVTLGWRLAATGAALAAGTIDTYRARLIADATAPLSEAAAREAEARVLPAAGQLTYGQLRAALARAVIAADPQGAEERRKQAEQHADVRPLPRPGRHRHPGRDQPARGASRGGDGPDRGHGPGLEIGRRRRRRRAAARPGLPRPAAGHPARHPPSRARPARTAPAARRRRTARRPAWLRRLLASRLRRPRSRRCGRAARRRPRRPGQQTLARTWRRRG